VLGIRGWWRRAEDTRGGRHLWGRPRPRRDRSTTDVWVAGCITKACLWHHNDMEGEVHRWVYQSSLQESNMWSYQDKCLWRTRRSVHYASMVSRLILN
jgi:hypothetical protein